MSGWNDLGELLGGGSKIGQAEAYQDQLGKNYRNFHLLEQAKRERSVNMARDSLPSTFQRLGFKEELVNMVLANDNPSFSQLGDAQNPNFFRGHEAAWQASGLDGGTQDLGRVATAQSLASGKSLEAVTLQGGYKFNKYDPNTTMQLTDLGQADLGVKNANMAQSYASAGNSNASANQTNLETGQRQAGKHDSFNSKESGADGGKADYATIVSATRQKLAQINAMVTTKGHTDEEAEKFRKAERQKVYTKLKNAGYGKIAKELGGDGE